MPKKTMKAMTEQQRAGSQVFRWRLDTRRRAYGNPRRETSRRRATTQPASDLVVFSSRSSSPPSISHARLSAFLMPPVSLRFFTCVLMLFVANPVRAAKGEAVSSKARTPPNYTAEIAAARTGWVSESTAIRELLAKMRESTTTLQNLEDRLRRNREELSKLTAEKEAALKEMRAGMFCSGCGKTRSQILAQNDRFPHPGQRSIPPTPKQIQALEASYDGRIAALKKQRAPLDASDRKHRSQVSDLYHRFNTRKPVYHRHISREQELRRLDWGHEKLAVENQLRALRQNVFDAEQAIKKATTPEAKKNVPALETNLRILERQFADSRARGEAAEARTRQQADGFVQAALKNLELTAAAAKPVPNKFGLPGGWYLSKVILNPPTGVACAIAPLRRFELPGRSDPVRGRLESVPARRPAGASDTPKSMRELLEGK